MQFGNTVACSIVKFLTDRLIGKQMLAFLTKSSIKHCTTLYAKYVKKTESFNLRQKLNKVVILVLFNPKQTTVQNLTIKLQGVWKRLL